MKPITYVSDQPVDYSKALTNAGTLKELQDLCHEYQLLAADACAIVDKMTEADFKEWRKVLESERQKKFSGVEMVEKYGDILLPAVMLQVAVIAEQYKAPWGLAYIRCKEAGFLKEENGVAVWYGNDKQTNAETSAAQPDGG